MGRLQNIDVPFVHPLNPKGYPPKATPRAFRCPKSGARLLPKPPQPSAEHSAWMRVTGLNCRRNPQVPETLQDHESSTGLAVASLHRLTQGHLPSAWQKLQALLGVPCVFGAFPSRAPLPVFVNDALSLQPVPVVCRKRTLASIPLLNWPLSLDMASHHAIC